MELSNILKTLVNNLKKYYAIFIGIWFVIGLLFFIPSSRSDDLFALIYLLYVISSLSFCVILGSIAYGSFGKTYMLLQNNRKVYGVCCIIFCLINSFVFSLIAAFLRINSYSFYYNKMTIELFIILILCFATFFSIGGLYGLFVKHNKKIKRIVLVIFFILLSIFGMFTISIGYQIVIILVENEYDSGFFIIASFLLLSYIFTILNTIYYNKLNIIKAYSIE